MKEEKFLVDKYGTKILTFKASLYIFDALKNKEYIFDIMQWYKMIAEKYGTSCSCVERNLRHFRAAVEDKKKNQEFINALILEYKSN